MPFSLVFSSSFVPFAGLASTYNRVLVWKTADPPFYYGDFSKFCFAYRYFRRLRFCLPAVQKHVDLAAHCFCKFFRQPRRAFFAAQYFQPCKNKKIIKEIP